MSLFALFADPFLLHLSTDDDIRTASPTDLYSISDRASYLSETFDPNYDEKSDAAGAFHFNAYIYSLQFS